MARAACAVVAVVTVTVAVMADTPATAHERPPRGFPTVDPVEDADRVYTYLVAVFWTQLDTALHEIAAYVEAIRANEERIAAESAAARATPPAPARGMSESARGAGGSCYDGPIPPGIVTRESNGNPAAVNPSSGAFGCFQFLPSTWNASCSDLSRDVAGQIACADRISNGGRNLQPWAATR